MRGSKIDLKICYNSNDFSDIITDPETLEVIGDNCGAILKDKLHETRAEWNAFCVEDWDAKARIGSSLSLSRHDRGLSTIIGKVNRDASGQEINSALHHAVER